MTQNEWWDLLTANWSDIKSLIETFSSDNKPEMNITAPMAEKARLAYLDAKDKIKETGEKLKELAELQGIDFEELCKNAGKAFEGINDYDAYLNNRDLRMIDLLSDTYWNIPESTDCWRYKGFGVLCDLCSESCIFSEDSE